MTGNRVWDFHVAFGLPVRREPTLIPLQDSERRMTLLREEMHEVMQALTAIRVTQRRKVPSREESLDLLTDLAKELADLRVVLEGTAVEFGIPLDYVFGMVCESNMSKLGADGKPIYREDGKVLKGPNYHPAEPAINRLLGAM